MSKRPRTDSNINNQEYKSINTLVDDVFKTKNDSINENIDKALVILLNYIKNLDGFEEFIKDDNQKIFIKHLFNYENNSTREKTVKL